MSLLTGEESLRKFTESLESEFGEEGETPVETEETGERPRNEKGQFVKEESPQEPEVPEGYGERWKTKEDVERSYRELELKIAEQGQEVGELRKITREMEELRARMDQAQQQPQWDARTQSAFDRQLEENPAAATQMAAQKGDWQSYEIALQAWGEVDPFSAARFDSRLQVMATDQRLQAQWQSQYEPKIQNLTQQNQQEGISRAWQAVAARHDDFSEFSEQLLEAAQSAPELVSALQSGNQPDAERMFENLYWMTKGRQGNTLKEAVQKSASQKAEEAEKARAEGTVATASLSNAQGDKSPLDEWKDQIVSARPVSVRDELARSMRGQ